MLLEQKGEGLPLNAVNKWHLTPLAVATLRHNKDVAELLKAGGAKLASGMHTSFYPLHLAALQGDVGELLTLMECSRPLVLG